jgi:fatty-acyl-CoA synthase
MALSYTHGVANRPLIGKTIGQLLDDVATEFPDNEALVSVFEGRRFTYKAFRKEVNEVARALLAMGVQKGDRVAIWSTNCAGWVLAQFATARIGAILVNINPAYRLQELNFALRQSECQVLVSGESFKDADYAGMLRSLIPELSGAKATEDLHSEKFPHLRRIVFLGKQTQPGMLNWE